MIFAIVQTGGKKILKLEDGKWTGKGVSDSLLKAINQDMEYNLTPINPDPVGWAAKRVAKLTKGRIIKRSPPPKFDPKVVY